MKLYTHIVVNHVRKNLTGVWRIMFKSVLSVTVSNYPHSTSKWSFRGPGGFVRGADLEYWAKIYARELVSVASRGLPWPPVIKIHETNKDLEPWQTQTFHSHLGSRCTSFWRGLCEMLISMMLVWKLWKHDDWNLKDLLMKSFLIGHLALMQLNTVVRNWRKSHLGLSASYRSV